MSNRQARSRATQNALMRAAERLIAERGIGGVAIRDIVATADQKNESALQYHFGSLAGLIEAIHQERSEQTRTKRGELLEALLEQSPQPSLRELCELMVRPDFELARTDVGFRRYIKAFGPDVALAKASALSVVTSHGAGGPSGRRLAELLRSALPHLSDHAYARRMDAVARLCSASMYHQSRQKSAFRGEPAELFLHSLVDAIEGLLSQPESDATRSLARRLGLL